MSLAATRYVDWKGWDQGTFGRCSRVEADLFDAEWRRAEVEGPAGRRVLELGFGNGAFAGWCRERGAAWTGLEADPVCRDRAVAAGFDTRESVEACAGERFDAVCAWDVLEHVPAEGLPRLVSDLGGLLVPGGLLIARFPNGDSPLGLANQYGDWTHCTVIGEGRWRQLAFQAGLDCVAWRRPAMPVRAGEPVRALRRLARGGLDALVSTIVRGLFHPGTSWCVTANVVGHLRRRDR